MKLGMMVLLLMCAATQSKAFTFDSTMPADQIASIQYDQAYLQKLQFLNNDADQETARVMGIDGGLSATALQAWMDERVSTVISENIDLDKTLMVARGMVLYPEADVLPDQEKPTAKVAEKPEDIDPNATKPQIITIMGNIGTAIYTTGKVHDILAAFVFSGSDDTTQTVVMRSPHHGVIQVGLGLFMKNVLAVNPEAQNTPANAIVRLMTFFHESRHSDGHGKSLGFSHSICPAGHAYEGAPACDKSLNGAYTIGADILKSLTQACADCSTKDVTILNAIQADSDSRVQRTYTDANGAVQLATNLDPTFEEIIGFIPASSMPPATTPAQAPAETPAPPPLFLAKAPASLVAVGKP